MPPSSKSTPKSAAKRASSGAPATGRQFWLVKSEPDCFSYDDLLEAPRKTTHWSGVRNYQARNFMKAMKNGDGVLFYYSGAEPPGVVGTAEVVREAYPDFTALDPKDDHFDPKASEETPIWFMVDIQARDRFDNFLPLNDLRHVRELEKMELLKRGSRLSVQPVSADEWKVICRMGQSSRRG
jgi:predicted RNA-binding protein with PUA-like domain